MSEKLTPKFTPFTAADVVDRDGVAGWASRVKFANPRQVRVGTDYSIEARLNLNDQWQPIMLPNGGTQFESLNEAAKVLRMIQGTDPIPNVITPPQ